jgi:integrase
VFAGRRPDGRQHRVHRTVHAPDNRTGRRQAERALAALVAEVAAGQHHTSERPTVDELLDAWLAHIVPTRAARTVEAYESKARLYIRPQLGRHRLDRLAPYQIDQLYTALRQRGLSEKTVAHTATTLRAALNQAIRWRWLAINPMDGTDPPEPRRPEIRVPTVDEVRAILGAARPALAAIAHTAASTGHRKGSLLGLRRTDLNLDAGTAVFQRAISYTPGQPLIVKETKGRTVARPTLEPALVARLRTHLAAMAERALAYGTPLHPDAYVWSSSSDCSTPWHPAGFTDLWLGACRRAGVAVRFHDLKHFACTQMLAAGVPVWEVAQRTGTSAATIERVYGHFIPGRDVGAAQVMDRLLG